MLDLNRIIVVTWFRVELRTESLLPVPYVIDAYPRKKVHRISSRPTTIIDAGGGPVYSRAAKKFSACPSMTAFSRELDWQVRRPAYRGWRGACHEGDCQEQRRPFSLSASARSASP